MPSFVILAIPFVYVVLQVAALGWEGGAWRVAAWLPAVLMGAALALMVLGMLTGADIAAMGLVLGLPAATLYLAILWPVRLIFGR